MYRKYIATSDLGGGVMSSAFKTVVSIISPGTLRPCIYDFSIGTIGTPADNVTQVQVIRETGMTAGTNNTPVTPNPLDPGDPAATSSSGGAWTTEPATGAILHSVGVNARATYRWVAAQGSELVMPATAQAGIGLRVLSPVYVLDDQATVYFSE